MATAFDRSAVASSAATALSTPSLRRKNEMTPMETQTRSNARGRRAVLLRFALVLVGALAAPVSLEAARPPTPVVIVGPVPVPMAMPTHQGVPPEDFVMLFSSFNAGDPGGGDGLFRRQRPDATRDADEFVVPQGRLFIATDFEFSAFGVPPGDRAAIGLLLWSELPGEPLRILTVHSSSALAGPDGKADWSVNSTTGFAAGPLTRVRRGPGPNAGILVRGYLVDAPPVEKGPNDPADPVN